MSTAESLGLSSARLSNLDRVMKERYVDTGLLPGILTQVYRDGQLAHTGMSGLISWALIMGAPGETKPRRPARLN